MYLQFFPLIFQKKNLIFIPFKTYSWISFLLNSSVKYFFPFTKSDTSRRPHTASVNVSVGETVAFKVNFCPTAIQRSQAHVRVSVIDNQYEDSVIQLVGEGYEDEISLDKINSVDVPIDPESEEGNMAEDDVSGNFQEYVICLQSPFSFKLIKHHRQTF